MLLLVVRYNYINAESGRGLGNSRYLIPYSEKERLRVGDFKMNDIEFSSIEDPSVNFQLEACRLVQANAVLTELVKEAAVEKYSLSEKIHCILEQIRKLEAKAVVK